MPRDPAADLTSGLEVTPTPGSGFGDAASASPDPGTAGSQTPGGHTETEKSALNVAKEALRKVEEGQGDMRSMAETNRKLAEALVSQRWFGRPSDRLPGHPAACFWGRRSSLTGYVFYLTSGPPTGRRPSIGIFTCWVRPFGRFREGTQEELRICIFGEILPGKWSR